MYVKNCTVKVLDEPNIFYFIPQELSAELHTKFKVISAIIITQMHNISIIENLFQKS